MKKYLLMICAILISHSAISDDIYINGQIGRFYWSNGTEYKLFHFNDDSLTFAFPYFFNSDEKEISFPSDRIDIYIPDIIDGDYCSSDSPNFNITSVYSFNQTGNTGYTKHRVRSVVFPRTLKILSPRSFYSDVRVSSDGSSVLMPYAVIDYVVFQSNVPSGLVTSGLLLCAEKIYYPISYADEWVSALTSANYDGQMYAFNSDRWYVDDEWNTAESIEYIRPPTSAVTVTNYVDQIVYHDFTNVIYQTQFITNVTSIVNISNIVNTIDVFHTNVVDILNPITIFNTNQIDVVNVITSTISEVIMTTNIVSISSIEHMQDSDVGKDQNDFMLQPGLTTAARKTSSLIYNGDYCAGIVYLNIYKSSSTSKVKVDGKIAFGDGKVYLITAGYGKIVDGILSVSLKSGLGQCVLNVGVNGIMGAVANKYDVLPIISDANMGTLNGNLNFRYFDKSKGLASRTMKIKGVAVNGEHLLVISDGTNAPYKVYGEKVK